jgi:MFS family permease
MVGVLMLVPLLPFYVQKFAPGGFVVAGCTLGEGQLTSIAATAFTLAQSVSSPRWGRFSDRHGRRPALMVALVAAGIAYLVFGFAGSLWVLLLARLVQGAGGGTVGVIQAYVADSVPPEERAKALGWLSAATNLGVSVGPLIGSFAVWLGKRDLVPGVVPWHMGDAAPGIVAAAICALNLLFVARRLPESNPEHRASAGTQQGAVGGATWSVITRPSTPSSRLIWIYAIAIGASQGVNVVLALFLGRRFHVTADTIGYFWTWVGAISVFARSLLLGPLIDRFGEARLSRLGIVLLAGGLVSITFADSLPTLALALGLVPLGTACTFPCVTGLLSKVIAKEDRGLYMGLQQTYGGFTRILGPLFFGWAFDHLGIATPYWFAAAFVLATLPLGYGLGRYAGRPAPAKA